MAERLLNDKESARRLGISVRSFHRYRAKLCAAGLQMVRAGRRVVFRERSINKLIENAAEREEALYDADLRTGQETEHEG